MAAKVMGNMGLFFFQYLADLGCYLAFRLVEAAAVAAVAFFQGASPVEDAHHAALVQLAAIAGDEFLLFHFYPSTTQKPRGARVSQSEATVCRFLPKTTRPAGMSQASPLRLT